MNKILSVVLVLSMVLTCTIFLTSCVKTTTSDSKLSYSWEVTNKRYSNFTDLGNYLLLADELKEVNFDEILEITKKHQNNSAAGCTCVAKVADNGDMLVGRNMDIDARQFPIILTKTSFGKYKTMNITYAFTGPYKYKDILAEGKIDESYLKAMPFNSTDVFNEKGLYVETNMRMAMDSGEFKPTNPGKKRVPWSMVPALVCANCATVEEAIEFIKNSYDYYVDFDEKSGMKGWNFAFMLADATGKYGLLESIEGKLDFIPYQYGQANFYVSPTISQFEINGCGFGRLDFVNERLFAPQTKEDMLDLMAKIYFSNEILYTDYAHRDEKGNIIFVNDKGEKMCDWRSDYSLYKDDIKIHSPYIAESLIDSNFEKLQKQVHDTNIENVKLIQEFKKGNEDPLRDNGTIWTTSLSFGVNCTDKSFILKIWEREDLKINFKW